jgi:hypothetical protein
MTVVAPVQTDSTAVPQCHLAAAAMTNAEWRGATDSAFVMVWGNVHALLTQHYSLVANASMHNAS